MRIIYPALSTTTLWSRQVSQSHSTAEKLLPPTCSMKSAQTQHTVSANYSLITLHPRIHLEISELLSHGDSKRKDAVTVLL